VIVCNTKYIVANKEIPGCKNSNFWSFGKKKKGKAIPVTGLEGPWGCETSRLPHFLDDRLTDGARLSASRAVRPLPTRKIPGTHFC
jgi:hypothetical protein